MRRQITIGRTLESSSRRVVIRKTRTALNVGLMAVGFILGALVLPVCANPIDLPPGQGQLDVTIQDGIMSLQAEKVPLAVVLQAIADQAGSG